MTSVSVIVPVYNKRAYLQRSVDSILAQDLPQMEVLLIDDASTDGSYELCKERYGSRPEVRILRQPQNRGAGAARNLGLRAARGRYVAFVDADDIIQPGYLRRLYETALLYRADIVSETGAAIEHVTPIPKSFAARCRWIWEMIYPTAPYYKICRTEYLRKHAITFLPITFLEDVLFSMQALLSVQGGVLLPSTFYDIIEAPESITRGNPLAKCPAYMDSILHAFRSLDEYLLKLPEAQADPTAREMLFLFLIRLSVENHFQATAKKHPLEEINASIAPILQREFGVNAHYVQMLLDLCIGKR